MAGNSTYVYKTVPTRSRIINQGSFLCLFPVPPPNPEALEYDSAFWNFNSLNPFQWGGTSITWMHRCKGLTWSCGDGMVRNPGSYLQILILFHMDHGCEIKEKIWISSDIRGCCAAICVYKSFRLLLKVFHELPSNSGFLRLEIHDNFRPGYKEWTNS